MFFNRLMLSLRRLPWLVIGPAIAFIALRSESLRWHADSAFLGFESPQKSHVVHFSNNGYFIWPFDFVIRSLTWSGGFPAYVSLQLLLCGLGTFLCLSRQGHNLRHSLVVAAGFPMLLFGLFGADTTVFGVVTWLPFLLLAMLRWSDDIPPGPIDYLVLLVLSLVFVQSANVAALPTVLALLVVVFPITLHQPPNHRHFLCLLGILPAFLYSFYFIETPRFPLYPTDSHLIPGYGTGIGLEPHFGPMTPRYVLDRAWERQIYWFPASGLAVLLIMVLLFNRGTAFADAGRTRVGTTDQIQSLRFATAATCMSLFLFVSIVCDSQWLTPDLSQSMPLQSFTRLFPGFYFVSISLVALVLALFFFVFTSSSHQSPLYRALWFVSLVFVLGFSPIFEKRALQLPRFTHSYAATPMAEVMSGSESAERSALLTILNSPSYWIVRERGLKILQEYSIRKSLSFVSAESLGATFHGLARIEEPDVTRNRWTTKRGGQAGGEWLMVRLPEARSLSAARILTGAFFTDFPRGIEVRLSPNCSGSETNFDSFMEVYRQPIHEGELLFAEGGFPYYSEQYTASMIFPDSGPVQCIVFRQIGKEDFYNWTVTAVEIAFRP